MSEIMRKLWSGDRTRQRKNDPTFCLLLCVPEALKFIKVLVQDEDFGASGGSHSCDLLCRVLDLAGE